MADLAQQLTDFIVDNFLLGDASRTPEPGDSLVESGVLDSTGVLELIEFLEAQLGIRVSEADTVPENLDSVDRLVAYISRRQQA